MRAHHLIRSVPVRNALALVAISTLVMGVLLAVIHGWMLSLLDRHLVETIETHAQVLRDDFEQDGRGAMLGLVARHHQARAASPLHILVLDARGKVLGGDLSPVAPVVGWQTIARARIAASTDNRGAPLRGLGAWFDADTFVLVTDDTRNQVQSARLLLLSFGSALAITVVLVLGGGVAVGVSLLRRVERMDTTARQIMAGDLSRRIPVGATGDELGRLAEGLNRMLARIEELVANLRHISGDIAHDLRTPLGRLRQRLDACRIKPRSAAEYEAAIDGAITDSDTVLATFDALLRISQIESGVVRSRFTSVDLGAVAENVVEAYAAVAEDESRRLEAHIEPNLAVLGDRELLTQMLANLIENALHHTPRGARVELRAELAGDGARLTVSDDGPGIPAAERERVFRRFYRLDASRSSAGNGLGLSLVSAIAKLHGATATLEDNHPGLQVVISSIGTSS